MLTDEEKDRVACRYCLNSEGKDYKPDCLTSDNPLRCYQIESIENIITARLEKQKADILARLPEYKGEGLPLTVCKNVTQTGCFYNGVDVCKKIISEV